MLSKSEKKFTSVFIIILIAELISGSINTFNSVHFFAKPALLGSLLFYFWFRSDHLRVKTRLLITLALGFSLLGDILLMYIDISERFFIGGLISFLVAHIFYCIVFWNYRNKSNKGFLFIVLLLAYASCLFFLMKDGLGTLLIPVCIYMVVILMMSTFAFLRRGQVTDKSFKLVFFGAILFMISDSILALNKFYKPLEWSHISIMLSYAFAQLCIVFGLLKQR